MTRDIVKSSRLKFSRKISLISFLMYQSQALPLVILIRKLLQMYRTYKIWLNNYIILWMIHSFILSKHLIMSIYFSYIVLFSQITCHKRFRRDLDYKNLYNKLNGGFRKGKEVKRFGKCSLQCKRLSHSHLAFLGCNRSWP